VRNDGGDEGPLLSMQCERPVEGVEQFAKSSLWFEPGGHYRYSSYGWILVSAAVEAVAKEPFLTFIAAADLRATGHGRHEGDSATKEILDWATSYFPKFASDPHYGLDLMRPIDYSCYAGSSVSAQVNNRMPRRIREGGLS